MSHSPELTHSDLPSSQPRLPRVATAVRWIARIGSLVSTAYLIAFFTEGGDRSPRLIEIALLLLFPAGIVLGFAIAWRRELGGALVTLSSLGGFYLLMYSASGELPAAELFA
ncbi:MAG: hypothetical protein RL885_22095, partial [Planctomycetota bacterium]